ncbi:MAG: acyl-CoA thioesterase domain-containing protein [Burkholderiales bacterium]
MDAQRLRERVLTALAANRQPGFHLPGYFLELTWPRIGNVNIEHALKAGPHCRGTDGRVHPAMLAILVDSALATAPRLKIQPGARQATVHLSIQYTGHVPSGDLSMVAQLEGFFAGDAVPHALTRGVLSSDGQTVAYANGTFVVLPAPPGAKLAPLPWQTQGGAAITPLDLQELDANERSVLRAAEAALSSTDSEHAFIERFWGISPRQTQSGSVCRVKVTPQIGNRVGHVQGGILFAVAQATATAAVPRHPAVSNITAWYISPGQGSVLNVRSKVIHAGRSFSVVRTEIRNEDKTRVLEVVSNHAAVVTPAP